MLDLLGTVGFTAAAMVRPRLGRRRMQRYQADRLRALLKHANEHVPFYRDLYREADVDPRTIRDVSDLARLPIVDRAGLRGLGDTLDGMPGLIKHQTSGSTGQPMRFFRTLREERKLNMLRWRMYFRLGLRPGDRMAKLKTTWESMPAKFERLQRASAGSRFLERRLFDCLADPAETARAIVDYRPHILTGYPSALLKLAEILGPGGGNWPELRRVFAGGEYFSVNQRKVLETCFDAPVLDTYGASECNVVGWECPETGQYHVSDDGVVVEVCRDGVPVQPGEEGEIILTVLHSRTMPIIRFTLGDIAVAGEPVCNCGQPFSTLGRPRGRIHNWFSLPDGRQIHALHMLNEIILSSVDWTAEYQVTQEKLDVFRMRVVPRREVKPEEERHLRQVLLEQLGEGVTLHIDQVDSIPPGKNGKFDFCRSLV